MDGDNDAGETHRMTGYARRHAEFFEEAKGSVLNLVSGRACAVSDTQASKRLPNILANKLRAASHSRTFLPSLSKLRIAR
ncbi:hypothetical protein [Paracoccus aerius]|uniref:hypothetical protein n=1 Tax=Paracoccus aerius TaxID=1915382 RepID=UPI00199C0D60|nr:hypothetical protein [Paracoccus aerius]GHG20994.1 hypothetical protein GCM10017322_17850 [Paracoccus aerius]